MNERDALREALYGTSGHLHVLHALEGLDAGRAGRLLTGATHTIFQILGHMVFWQDFTLARLLGHRPATPRHAEESWPYAAAPEDGSEWEAAVVCLGEGLRGLEALVADPAFDLDAEVPGVEGVTQREELLMIQGHDSYHLGQIVQLRQQLGAWPPPRGGDTW